MRLNNALTAAVRAAGVRVINGSFVDTPVIADGRVRGVSVESSGSPRTIVGDAFVLATGGFESGALTLDSYGEVTERIFGLPLAGLDEGPLLAGDYWGGEQPLFKVGVAVDETMRVTAVGARPSPAISGRRAASWRALSGGTRSRARARRRQRG